MFNIKAENQGFVQVQFTVRSQILNEKITKNLEIEKHYIFEQVCTTGKLSSAKENDLQTEKIVIPQNIEDENGFVSFTLDSTKLAPLSSAVDYVFTYPYGCLEQRSAKLLPLIAFKDYISVFNLKSEINDIDKFILDELSEWKKSPSQILGLVIREDIFDYYLRNFLSNYHNIQISYETVGREKTSHLSKNKERKYKENLYIIQKI